MMRRRLASLLAAVPIALIATATLAEDTPPPVDPAIAAHQSELDAVTSDIAVTKERQAELKAEIESLGSDQATLNRSLVEAGQQVQKLELQIEETEKRLSDLLAREDTLRASLAARREVLAEVLAALQLIGYRPPPAILVKPEDALASIHSAILLGAVVPELRAKATALVADLDKLVALRTDQETERDRLRQDAAALAEGRERIALLIAERKKQQAASEAALSAEVQRAASLADQADSLRELISRIEQENATAAAAAAEAKKAAELARNDAGNTQATNLGDPDRLSPKVPFADAKGLLPLPVNGKQILAFGDKNDIGGTTQGISIATLPSAQVSSPADGWVVYAGPFRSYGQLLILNTGDGYHVLLAGMERIDVQLGQFVLAGEPVAVMAAEQLAAAGAVAVGATQPVLYVEFRKDGASIDPAPWWAASNAQKVGG
jgi:murein hydrolase activator